MANSSTFERIKIGIASPNDIRSWSYGEVKKPETINYRTFKPERDGLFCERIFGPTRDWECHCGRYKKIKFKNIVCDRCGVEVTKAKVRRERMGHIELVAAVSHVWYLKGVPSPLSLLLDIAPRPLEKVLYYASYIVTEVDRNLILDNMNLIEEAIQEEVYAIRNMGAPALGRERPLIVADEEDPRPEPEVGAEEEAAEEPEEAEEAEEAEGEDIVDEEPVKAPSVTSARRAQRERNVEDRVAELLKSADLFRTIQPRQLISESEYQNVQRILEIVVSKTDASRGAMVKAGLGAAAIKSLLEKIDLDKLSRELKQEVKETSGARRARLIKRLEYVEAFRKSQSRPEWMVLDAIPVIPPELRPMVQLDGGRFATSDLNDLYRRIINRNNRLKKITDIRAPDSIINHEKRLLQEAVDALIDNSRRSRPVTGSNGRPLRSLSDMLKGKEGRFRKNLLGKRVDYSGRSVIVVGPELKLNQCGMPKEMALELFKPFVMKTLVEREYTPNIKTAKKMIEKMHSQVWDALEDVIREHPVLLNRAPTLHRLGIQAFQPVLVDGKAIQLHPLVCKAFNADFDGDQMPAHVPLGATAQAEARILMMSTQNLFSPADGRPIVAPIQDLVLGMYYLTQDEPGAKGEGSNFASVEDAELAYSLGYIALHAKITVHGLSWVKETPENPNQSVTAAFGRFLFTQSLPEDMRPLYINREMNTKGVAQMVSDCFKMHGNETTVRLLDEIKDMGFRFATQSGTTIALHDLVVPEERQGILDDTESRVRELRLQFDEGLLAEGDRSRQSIQLWSEA
ncbi:MAG: DNA-directed RNA polymerase subunit beta', partial [Chloroflexi bacterium]|nr:DNA-directed RNA polymerase subunit beta' [Chloroflexota bacterium]